MATKKVLGAIGLVCVAGPAAALAMMNSQPGYSERARNAAADILWMAGLGGSVAEVEPEETASPPPARRRSMEDRVYASLVPGASLSDLDALTEPGPVAPEGTAAAGAGGGLSLGAQTEIPRQAAAGTQGFGTGGGHSFGWNGSLGGGGGPGFFGGAGAGASGGGAGGSDARSLSQVSLEDLGTGLPEGATAEGRSSGILAAISLPASAWLILASVAGLAFLGKRGRTRFV